MKEHIGVKELSGLVQLSGLAYPQFFLLGMGVDATEAKFSLLGQRRSPRFRVDESPSHRLVLLQHFGRGPWALVGERR